MATLYKEYYVPAGTYISESFTFEGFNQGANPTPPDWFQWVNGVVLIDIQTFNGYTFTAPPQIGTYDIYFIDFTASVYYIRINVIVGQYSLYNNCCGDRNIVWLGIHGGWQNYIFTGIKTFQVQVGKEKQFKTSGLVLKNSEVNDVYDGELLTTGDIPKSHVNVLDGLRAKSVQAFLYNEDTEAWDIPIVIDRGSYTKFKSNDKFYEVRLKFIYAEEILVQTQ